MKYLLSILILFSGLSFSISKDELRERYKNVNEEDILLVCDTSQTNPDLKLRILFTISEKSDWVNLEMFNDNDVYQLANIFKMKETTRKFEIFIDKTGFNILIDRFTLEMKYGRSIMQCRKVDRFGYLIARAEVQLMAEEIRAKRKI